MRIQGIIWLDDVIDKLAAKHNVRQNEILEVFSNQPYFRFVEKGHRSGENVYAALGQTKNGRYLIVFFIYKKDGRAIILSARNMTPSERRRYEQR
ncbi:MAG: BrnT family toxin [Deltaproteobacteria bacterium]|nr:BrnT family toxin [Deltaproteobacteria bacterium]